MKKINSILRTLCLAAMLCMASVNASAYIVYDISGTDNSGKLSEPHTFMEEHSILVIEQTVSVKKLNIEVDKAFIIKPGVFVYVSENFTNSGKLYVFGTLSINDKCNVSNASAIYKMNENAFSGKSINGNIYTSGAYSPRMIHGDFPVTTTSGWNNYWEGGIACDDDYYPIGGSFEDEACTRPINDLAAWKEAHSNTDLGLKIDGTAGNDWEYWGTDEKKGFFYNGNLTLEGSQSFEADNDFKIDVTGKFTFTRDMTPVKGKWQAWYEPFEVELTTGMLDNMDAAQIAGILTDAEGNTVIAFKKMKESEVMKANTPYVIRFKDESGSLKLEYNSGKTIYKSAENSYKFSSMYDNFEIGGIYTAKGNSNWYALSKEGAFKKMNGTPSPTLQPQRIWLTVTPRTDSPYYTPTTKSIGTKSAGTPDVIRIVILGYDGKPEDGSDFKPIREAKIINADGQSVNRIQRGQVYRISGNVNE